MRPKPTLPPQWMTVRRWLTRLTGGLVTAKFTVLAQAFTQEPAADMACAQIQIDFLRPN